MPFDIKAPDFYDGQAITKEWQRVFDICNGCRRCFHLCPSFDFMFERLDGPAVDGDAEKLTAKDFTRVVDLCYECKLCFNHCPYTPPHRFDIDFPRFMLRAKLAQAKKDGVRWQDRLMSDTERLGKLSAPVAPIVNLTNTMPPARFLIEKVMSVHRQRNLPQYHRQTFRAWYKKHYSQATKPQAATGKVALFYTCFVNFNDPAVGIACVKVLQKQGLEVIVPEQQCCGMPFLDAKDYGGFAKKAKANLATLGKAVAEGYDIVAPGPTCSGTIRHEYPVLVDTPQTKQVSPRVYDICEYLMKLHQEGKLKTDFQSAQGKIAYHLPCHLKAQNIGYKSRDLMALVQGTQVTLLDHCSAHDGTWSMKKEFFELSLQVGKKLFDGVKEANADTVATDCPLAALQIEKATGKRPLHPVQVIARAYGI